MVVVVVMVVVVIYRIALPTECQRGSPRSSASKDVSGGILGKETSHRGPEALSTAAPCANKRLLVLY